MDWLVGVDWARMFVPDTPLLEILLRGSITYLVIYGLLRLVHKRQIGGVGMTDVLVIVLIADAAQNGMAGDYVSITDGILLIGTIVFWSYALEWLGYRVPAVRNFLYPTPLQLIRDGRPVPENMRRELLTDDELVRELRLQGLTDPGEVEEAFMESNGQVSVVRRDGEESERRRRSAPLA